MAKVSGLGRGLSSLIPPMAAAREVLPSSSRALVGEQTILQIPTGMIKPNPHQPRTVFNFDGMEELISSIKEHGIIQPLIVTKEADGYQLIAGERRLRASQMLELKTVPAIVRQVAQQQQLELALIENIQRRNLNPLEEAVAYQRLIDEFNLTQEQAAHRVGKTRSVLANTIRLLTLPAEIQKAVANEVISYSTARIIVGLPADQQLTFFHQVLKHDLTVRAVEQAAKKVSHRAPRVVSHPETAALAEELQQRLNTKVSIKRHGESGAIIIEFYSAEELQALAKKIGR